MTVEQRYIAGVGPRILAAVVDFCIIFAVLMTMLFVWGFYEGVVHPYAPTSEDAWESRGFLGWMVLDLAYHVWCQSGPKEATFGQRLLNLRLVAESGKTVSAGMVTGRYLLSLVSSILLKLGYVMALFSPRRQTLHDKICGTLVVRSAYRNDFPLDQAEQPQKALIEAAHSPASTSAAFSVPSAPVKSALHGTMHAAGSAADKADEHLWEQALREFDGPERHMGLYARVYAEADGDEVLARVGYLKERFNQLRAEVSVST